MNYHELIQLYFDRSGAILSLWTLYVVILGGLLAFSSIRKQPDRLTTALVSVLFVIFAYQNLGGLHDAADQRLAVRELIRQPSPGGGPTREAFEATLQPVTYGNIRTFHCISDVLTLCALWAMELRRRRSVQPTAHGL